MNKTEEISNLLSKLFSSYPQAQPTDEAMEAYLEAASEFEIQDLRQAVHNFLTGKAPGVGNAGFAPSAPMIGAETRRVANLRFESEDRAKRYEYRPPQLSSPDVERTAESQARVKALMEKTGLMYQAHHGWRE